MFDFANLIIAFLALLVTLAATVVAYRQGKSVQISHPFRSENHEWVEERHYSYTRLLGELVGLDYASVPDLTEKSEGHPTHWAPIFEKSRATWRLVVDDRNMIVAYWSFFFVTAKSIDRLKRGRLFEGALNLDEILLPQSPMSGPILVSMVATHPVLAGSKEISYLLYNSMIETIDELESQNIRITEVYANSFTPSGKSVAASLGLREIDATNSGHPVFVGEWGEAMRKHLSRRAERAAALVS